MCSIHFTCLELNKILNLVTQFNSKEIILSWHHAVHKFGQIKVDQKQEKNDIFDLVISFTFILNSSFFFFMCCFHSFFLKPLGLQLY